MLSRIDKIFSGMSPAKLLIIVLLAQFLVCLGDYLTGPELSFSIFYLVPVAFSAWYLNRLTALSMALMSSGLWMAVDLSGDYQYSYQAIPVWNALVRLGYFCITAILLDILKRRLELEKILARTDNVTGLRNRWAFMEQLAHSLALAIREQKPITLAYIDLDDFKQINDIYGHSEGDNVLALVAKTLTESTRRSDIVGRLGGDEFAIVLPNTDREGAERIIFKAKYLLKQVFESRETAVTCSIGAFIFNKPMHDLTIQQALLAADQLMYKVKRQGKNSVMFHELSGQQ